MEAVFLKLAGMSLSASWVIGAVILIRLLLRRAPRWTICLLWAVVAVKLVCPFAFESPFGLVPETAPVIQNIIEQNYSSAEIPAIRESAIEPGTETMEYVATEERSFSFTQIATLVWVTGVFAMLGYLLYSYLRLNRVVQEAVLLCHNIWICDAVQTPFILGIFRPRIYLPSGIAQEDVGPVVTHEMAHLWRKDHWWKPIGFALLAVFWFNPLVWIAYILMCRDIELACDEKVVRNMDMQGKKAYSLSLLEATASRKLVFACPIAFGEVAVKERVKNVLNYRKPSFWIILAAMIATVITAVCFLTVPPVEEPETTKAAEIFHFVPSREIVPPEWGMEMNIRSLLPEEEPETTEAAEIFHFVPSREIVPPEWGMDMNIRSFSPTGLTVDIIPETKYIGKLQTNEEYWLEQWSDHAWHMVPMAYQPEFSQELTDIPSTFSVEWEDLYGTLAPGRYRIGNTIIGEIGWKYSCYAEFDIQDAKIHQNRIENADGTIIIRTTLDDREISLIPIPSVTVCPKDLSGEDAQRIAKALFGDAECWDYHYEVFSRDEIQAKLDRWAPYTEAEAVRELYPEQVNSYHENTAQIVKHFLYEYTWKKDTAPLSPHRKSEWKFRTFAEIYRVGGSEIGSQNPLRIQTRQYVGDIPYQCIVEKNPVPGQCQTWIYASPGDGVSPDGLDDRLFRQQICGSEVPTQAQITTAQKYASEMLANMQLGEWVIDGCYVQNIGRDLSAPCYVIRVEAIPLLEGIPAMPEQQGEHAPAASFCFSGDGKLYSFEMYSPVVVLEVGEPEAVIDKECAIEKINAAFDNLPEALEPGEYDLEVTNVEYRLNRDPGTVGTDRYAYYPVLSFLGTLKNGDQTTTTRYRLLQ